MTAKPIRRTIWMSAALLALVLVPTSATAGNGWGNDRVADWNDAQCDDDEGTGNDWKCTGASKGSMKAHASGGHGWGNDRVADWNDAQCDDDEGKGNDWKCTGGSK